MMLFIAKLHAVISQLLFNLQFLFWTDDAGKTVPTFVAAKPSGTVASIKGSSSFIFMQPLYPWLPPNAPAFPTQSHF